MPGISTPVRPEFKVHRLNAEGMAKAQRIAEIFSYALNELDDVLGDCREKSIVKTKLEEAAFFAKRGMAQHVFNQE